MESFPGDFAQAIISIARLGGRWGVRQAQGEDDAEDLMGQVEDVYGQLRDMDAYGDDPVQIKDMALGAGGSTAAQILLGGEGFEDWQQNFQDACNPTPEQVSLPLWMRVQKLCWAASRLACAEAQGEDRMAEQAQREFSRHSRSLAGFGPGKTSEDKEGYHEKVKGLLPGYVVMFSGCKDSQTSADVSSTSSFGLPADAGPGGAGGACTNSIIKALLERDDYTWVSLLQRMRQILDGRYTQIPQLSCSRQITLTDPFSVLNAEPSGRTRAVLIGINYVGQNGELNGCHNDVATMKNYLCDHGYNEGDMNILMDDGDNTEPTKDNIREAMKWLVEGASAGDSLFFHYSGHGASVRDDDGDEADGKDECLVPVDYNQAGLMRDDEILTLLVTPLADGVTMTCVMDCCHSGSILDLPYMFKAANPWYIIPIPPAMATGAQCQHPEVLAAIQTALVICAPTFFLNKEVPRFSAALATLAACKQRGYSVLLVDGSPDGTGVAEALTEEGAVVCREAGKGKANALRQALREAGERFPSKLVFAFQELEKMDFVRCYEDCVPGLLSIEGGRHWDLCNPARSESSWATYPLEQVQEERFQNRLLDLNAQRYGLQQSLDWSFGPFLLRRELLHLWLNYTGESYDAQWGPMILAFRANKDVSIGTPVVDYRHSEQMKNEEEGNWKHAMVRFRQLIDTVSANQRVWEVDS